MSDHFTGQAAVAAGVTETSCQALEPFRASGLHSAMYVVPILGTLLSLVLLAGSRTVTKDMESLQEWMGTAASPPHRRQAKLTNGPYEVTMRS